MQINKIDNTGFGQISTQKARNALFYRLKSPERLIKFENISHAIDKMPLKVNLEECKSRCLKATVYDNAGSVLYEGEENFFRGKLNLNPNKFMKKLLGVVNSIKQS